MGVDLPDGYARGVAFSPDGARLVVASWSAVVVFDAKTMRPLTRLAASTNAVAAKYFNDGKRVLVVDAASARALDVKTGKELWKHGWPAGVQAGGADLSPDQETVAVALGEHDAVLLDAQTGTAKGELPVKSNALAYSPDGKQLALVGSSSQLIVLDVFSGSVAGKTETKETALEAVAWLDATTLVTGGVGGTVATWRGGMLVKKLVTAGWVKALATSHGRVAALMQGDQGVRVFDAASGKTLFAHDANAQGAQLAFSRDGKRLAFSDEGSEARRHEPRIVELATGTLSPSLERHDGTVLALEFAGTHLISGADDASVRIWNPADGAAFGRIPIAGNDGTAAIFALAPDGTIAVAAREGSVHVFDSAMKPLRTFKLAKPESIAAIAFTPDGKRLVVAPRSDQDLEIHDAQTTALVQKLAVGSQSETSSIAITPDGHTLLATAGGSVVAWDLATGKRVRTIPNAAGDMARIAIAPDGTRFAVAVGETSVAIRTLDGKLVKSLTTTERATVVAWSPDGKTLAIGHHHDRVELLPVDGGAGKLLDATGIWSLAYSHDGAHLATGGTNGTLLVWPVGS